MTFEQLQLIRERKLRRYRNLFMNAAERCMNAGLHEPALAGFLRTAFLDCNGCRDVFIGGSEGDELVFDLRFSAPGTVITHRIAQCTVALRLSPEELAERFFVEANEESERLAELRPPISPAAAWNRTEPVVMGFLSRRIA